MRNLFPSSSMRATQGFTLLELMIVLVVMAILVVSAISGYDFAVVKSRRSAAASCLMEASQAMERRYTTGLTYLPATTIPSCGNANQIGAFYTIPLTLTATARTYTLTIVPRGVQATKDTKCGTLGINQAGTKSETGTASSASECF